MRFRDELGELKVEIAEEVRQARDSWTTDLRAYQQERAELTTLTTAWGKDAVTILDGRYTDTDRAVRTAGAYLTFDDLVPLERMLADKKHREYAQTRYARANDGPDDGTNLATGAGLGAIVTYQGKTLVRLGGEKFYVSGTPPKGGWTPKGGTTSEFFIYKKSDIKKMYRLDYDTIKMGPKQGQLGWEHNQKGVAKVLNLKVTNHQPAGGWGRAAGTAIRIYKWGGRALFVAGLVASAVEIYYAENKARAIAKTGGAIAGGIGGAKLGALGGAEVGGYFGPVGAGIGAFVGGLVGGALGAWGGAKATEYVYDLVVDRLEDEDDWVVLTQDQVEPATSGGAAGE
jgi:phage tail tape-measure protein